jgi:hypothetical protein
MFQWCLTNLRSSLWWLLNSTLKRFLLTLLTFDQFDSEIICGDSWIPHWNGSCSHCLRLTNLRSSVVTLEFDTETVLAHTAYVWPIWDHLWWLLNSTATQFLLTLNTTEVIHDCDRDRDRDTAWPIWDGIKLIYDGHGPDAKTRHGHAFTDNLLRYLFSEVINHRYPWPWLWPGVDAFMRLWGGLIFRNGFRVVPGYLSCRTGALPLSVTVTWLPH